MSWESMAREAYKCDFPYCEDDFYQRAKKNNAIVKGGEILAFCKKHSERLEQEGVILRPLADIHKEMDENKNKKTREKLKREADAREREFISNLRKN
jgi:hypothetical protein